MERWQGDKETGGKVKVPFRAEFRGLVITGMIEIPPHGEDAVADECRATIDDPQDFSDWLYGEGFDTGAEYSRKEPTQ